MRDFKKCLSEFYANLSKTERDQMNAAFGIKVGSKYFWQVFNGYKKVSAERAIEIEKYTSGKVSKEQLLPDIFTKAS